MGPIIIKSWALCAVVAVVVAITWAAGGTTAGLAVSTLFLALLFLRDRFNLNTLWNWLAAGAHTALPKSSGAWDDLFATLYRRSRDSMRQQEGLSDALVELRRAAQALPDGIVLLDVDRHIQWINAQAEEHFGIRLATDGGQNITNLLRAPDFLSYLSRGQWDLPVVLRLRDGPNQERTLSVQLVSYGEQQTLLVSRDITRFERLETMRRDFVANVSHELKTPLTVLSGFLETIRELDLPPEQQAHYLSLMSEQATRMERLVSDLLTLSALEATKSPADEILDMGALIGRIEDAARQISHGHVLEFRIEPQLNLLGSETEIASALTNLVTNAIRYTPAGGAVTVVWESVEAHELTVAQFVVTDTGIGIPAQHLPRLTERFYRVDRGRSRQSGGTGLGLAIVKHVLTRHQARLEINSVVGGGSRFAAVFAERRILRGVPADAAAVAGKNDTHDMADVDVAALGAPHAPDVAL